VGRRKKKREQRENDKDKEERRVPGEKDANELLPGAIKNEEITEAR
jgi:hypothetical protein